MASIACVMRQAGVAKQLRPGLLQRPSIAAPLFLTIFIAQALMIASFVDLSSPFFKHDERA